MKTLILYFTTDGQTKLIAERLAQYITHETELRSLREHANMTDEHRAAFDKLVRGAAGVYVNFTPGVYKFLAPLLAIFNKNTTAFYGVNLTARKPNRQTPESNTYIRKFLQKILWRPTHVEVIAGALFYPRYSWFDRTMIRFIMKLTKGETDVSREYEYTDWAQVERFAQRLSKLN